MKIILWIKWYFLGKSMIYYEGYNCGCCGKWIEEPFYVRKYEANEFADTWGLCKECKNIS